MLSPRGNNYNKELASSCSTYRLSLSQTPSTAKGNNTFSQVIDNFRIDNSQ